MENTPNQRCIYNPAAEITVDQKEAGINHWLISTN
jgi:hypothetical protein